MTCSNVVLGDQEDQAVAVVSVSTATGQVLDTIEVDPHTSDAGLRGRDGLRPRDALPVRHDHRVPATHSQRWGTLSIVDTDRRTRVDRIAVSEGSNARAFALGAGVAQRTRPHASAIPMSVQLRSGWVGTPLSSQVAMCR